MAYATFSDFSTRYATGMSEADLSSHYLPFASSRLEALLAPYFTVPFSGNNLTARDLAMDLAYVLILQRSKEPKDSAALREHVEGRIAALAEGKESMITTSGEAIFALSAHVDVWSNTMDGAPVFVTSSDPGSWC